MTKQSTYLKEIANSGVPKHFGPQALTALHNLYSRFKISYYCNILAYVRNVCDLSA